MEKKEIKRVAMIGQKGVPVASGGVEKHVEELGVELTSRGVDVTIYNRSGYVKPKMKSYKKMRLVTVPTLKVKGLEAVIYSFLASIHAACSDYDIVHYHALGPSLMCWIPKIAGKKIVVTVHGLDWKRSKWGEFAKKYLRLGEVMATKRADKIVVVGSDLVNYFDKTYNKETSYIPNGIRSKETDKTEDLKQFELTPNKYILFLARIVPEKGCHYLLEAFRGMNLGDVKLVIAGGSGQTQHYFENLIREYQDPNIIFTNEVKGDIISELYCNAMFYVLPSDIEGLSISLLEAMSCGTCCLVSDIRENLNVIEQDGEYGYSFRHGDVEDLRHKIQYMMNHTEEIHKIGRRAKENVLEKYNWTEVTDKLLMEYQEIV